MSAHPDEVTAGPIVLRDDDNGIARLTLNQPAKYNTLSVAMLAELQNMLDAINTDDSVRVVILAANGKAFSAGHDLKEMRSSNDRAFHQGLFQQSSRMMLTINQMSQPVIAEVDGIATAAGCQLVANCDLAVATTESRFAVSGVNLGLFCSTPAVPLSRNLSRKRAMQMLLTGDFISANQALEYGLINELVDAELLKQTTQSIAEKIAAKSPFAIKLGKEMFYRQLTMDLAEAYAYAGERMACNMDNDDAREGFDAFIEKRKPNWKGQ
jgi:enoyl-CoA hydratase/carnithine racemase